MPFAKLSTGHTVQYVENTDLGYNAQESKLPIVMIHGLGSSQNYYVPVMPHLDGHRCVALSTYGAALSKSSGEPLTLEELAEDVVSFMDHLGIPKAVVAGHSMGGPMALTVAARYPDRVAGVVAIGPVNPSSIKPDMFTTRIETVTNRKLAFPPRTPIANGLDRWYGAFSQHRPQGCNRLRQYAADVGHDSRADPQPRAGVVCKPL